MIAPHLARHHALQVLKCVHQPTAMLSKKVMCTGGRLLTFIRDSPPPSRSGPKAPGGGGGSGRGDGGRGAVGRGGSGGGGGGVQVGQFGVVKGGAGGGGGAQAPQTSPCPQSNHTITINLTLTFAASLFGHASRVNWAAQDPPNFVHGCFCHIIALHFGPQHSF